MDEKPIGFLLKEIRESKKLSQRQLAKRIGIDRGSVSQVDTTEKELKEINKRLAELDREQTQLLELALKGFPEETVIKTNNRINTARANLKSEQARLQQQIDDNKQAAVNFKQMESFCRQLNTEHEEWTFEDKREALEALKIETWIDGKKKPVLRGVIPCLNGSIENASCWSSNDNWQFSLELE